MAASTQSHRNASSLRTASLQAHASTAPDSPHTPKRAVSTTSAFSSPAPGTRDIDESMVFEFGSRRFRAGFSNESAPRCSSGYGPEEQRRAGDYRRWVDGYENSWRKRKGGKDWSEAYELWRMDLRGVDLGLVGDKIERVVRDAYQKYLLHAMPRKLILILPPAFPRPLLSTLLTSLFANFQLPLITLLSSPVLSTIAAGLRSALVVDIGWHETIITGIFELRELLHCRTDRAGRMLSREMGKLLARESMKSQEWHEAKDTIADDDELSDEVSFEETEEVLARLAWCRSYSQVLRLRSISRQESPEETFADASEQLETPSVAEGDSEGAPPTPDPNDPAIIFPLQSTTPPMTVRLPMSRFAEPCETVLFAADAAADENWDDNEVPVHHLAYDALLSLPRDARGICMSRIIITGGASNIPGVKNRVIDEVAALFAERGWEKVRGKAVERRRTKLEEINRNLKPSRRVEIQKTSEYPHGDTPFPLHTPSPGLEDPELDPIDEKLRLENAHAVRPIVHGIVRGVETLGPWAGGALIGGLKIKGIAQIEQDKFLQQGLAGASKEGEINVATQRFSMGPGVPRGVSAGERSSWTLGVFG
ncbi:hypothetical protein FGG08_002821 [Glutinoglossum americanum]|uniref:Actin-like ATPase domain-containing protein n=1 Tax=Glutinoglossum americanum TaxID=1670608 RepID=A0A9P8I8U3_9PEZI|nr:hypothetical protein FGG08_002821 [Glutinoglossum americanum]